MKITHIGSVLLQPFPWVLVKVTTDEGLVGIGEAYHGAGVHQIVVDERLQRPLRKRRRIGTHAVQHHLPP